jgi:predicted O-methyltransferase YrrM
VDGLATLLARREKYDLVYVDGFHTRDATLVDTALAWPMLREACVIVWDDYLWETEKDSKDRPQEAVDWFMQNFRDQLDVFHKGYQVTAKRLSPCPMERQIRRR